MRILNTFCSETTSSTVSRTQNQNIWKKCAYHVPCLKLFRKSTKLNFSNKTFAPQKLFSLCVRLGVSSQAIQPNFIYRPSRFYPLATINQFMQTGLQWYNRLWIFLERMYNVYLIQTRLILRAATTWLLTVSASRTFNSTSYINFD